MWCDLLCFPDNLSIGFQYTINMNQDEDRQYRFRYFVAYPTDVSSTPPLPLLPNKPFWDLNIIIGLKQALQWFAFGYESYVGLVSVHTAFVHFCLALFNSNAFFTLQNIYISSEYRSTSARGMLFTYSRVVT